jgi:hypothetical protein
MTDLLQDVRHVFESIPDGTEAKEQIGSVSTYQIDPEKLPGMMEMRAYNEARIKNALRRGYRYYAGVDFAAASNDEAFDYTKERLAGLFSSLVIEVFCDGIQIGQKTSHTVNMALFYNKLGELFASEDFQAESLTLALQLTREPGVTDFFNEYTLTAATGLSHITGFAHGQGLSHKVWDIWLLAGTSMVTASYVAGQQLGMIWAEREVVAKLEEELGDDPA